VSSSSSFTVRFPMGVSTGQSFGPPPR
jgi:hypothetical protein